MLHNRQRSSTVFLFLTIYSYVIADAGNCNTIAVYTKNYTETHLNLLIASFVTTIEHDDNILEMLDLHSRTSGNFTINHLIYLYPHGSSHLNIMEAFIDVLLNETLMERQPFKIVAILTIINETELANLANIVSPYFIPIVPVVPLKHSKFRHMISLYKYYDNVITTFVKNYDRIWFLLEFVKTFNVKLISIFHDSKEGDAMQEINMIYSSSQYKAFCKNIHYVPFNKYQEEVALSVEAIYSNVLVFIFEDYELSFKMIQYVSKLSNKNKTIIVFNTNRLTAEKLDSKLINFNTGSLQIYVYKFSNNRSLIWSQFKTLIDKIHHVINISSISLIKTNQDHAPTRTFSKATQSPLIFFRLYIIFHILHSSLKYFQDLEVYLYETRNGRQNSSLVYSKALFNQWKCKQCTNKTMLQPVCYNKNCSAGFFPVYISQGCCWICQLCYPGFAKSHEGQHDCSQCPSDSMPNKNQTKCLKVQYQYFIISHSQQLTAIALSSVGIVYTLGFLAVFLFYKDTPIVKSSNLALSVSQLILHLIMSFHVGMAIFEQKKWICFMHSISGGYLLRFIMSIYIVKTNQLLKIFKSSAKINRSICSALKEASFPIVYICANGFITVIYLTLYHKYEYGIYQAKDPILKYNYCNLATYFYIDTSFVITLSMICSVQAFLARKLPSNFNETYYIFLGMFTTTVLLVFSIPLNGSFRHDGQKTFVNSFVIYCANMALISIAYGYKIHIMLFQKHRNTKEAFQRSMRQAMQKYILSKE